MSKKISKTVTLTEAELAAIVANAVKAALSVSTPAAKPAPEKAAKATAKPAATLPESTVKSKKTGVNAPATAKFDRNWTWVKYTLNKGERPSDEILSAIHLLTAKYGGSYSGKREMWYFKTILKSDELALIGVKSVKANPVG